MDKKNSRSERIIIVLALITLFFVVFLGYYRCPFKKLFGVPCPTCGMTRAFWCLLEGNVKGAFYYHPLWPVAIIAAILMILYLLKIIHPSAFWINIGIAILCILLVGCFIVRHIQGSEVVQIDTRSSIIMGFHK